MSKDQIEEMAQDIYDALPDYEHNARDCRNAAEEMFAKGWRKQSEGEWLSAYAYAVKLGVTDAAKLEELKGDKWWKFCSQCEQTVRWHYNFCPNCGAKMKGGAE